jgi:hypothetical protein
MSREELIDISYSAVKNFENESAQRRQRALEQEKKSKELKLKQQKGISDKKSAEAKRKQANAKESATANVSFVGQTREKYSKLPVVPEDRKLKPPLPIPTQPTPSQAPPQPQQSSGTNNGSGGVEKGGRVRSLRRLAVEAIAANLLLFESFEEVPIQYRAPIFIALARKQQLTSEHLKILLGTPSQKKKTIFLRILRGNCCC